MITDTSLCGLALSGHQLPPLCDPDNLTRGLAEANSFARHMLRLAPYLYEHAVTVPHVRNGLAPGLGYGLGHARRPRL